MEKDTFSTLLMDALVRSLMTNTVDQFGNRQKNIIDRALELWISNNKEEVYKAVESKIDTNKLAQKIAENVISIISGVNGSYSLYDREKYIDKLNQAITQELAKKIASDIDLKNKQNA